MERTLYTVFKSLVSVMWQSFRKDAQTEHIVASPGLHLNGLRKLTFGGFATAYNMNLVNMSPKA
jgi:hypothetical protein